MVYRFPTEADATIVESRFSTYFGHDAWADCYAERLQASFATGLSIIPEVVPPAVSREDVHATAGTFDLAIPTGQLYASELYAWRDGRIVVFLGVSGPQVQVARMNLSEIVDVLLAKSSLP